MLEQEESLNSLDLLHARVGGEFIWFGAFSC